MTHNSILVIEEDKKTREVITATLGTDFSLDVRERGALGERALQLQGYVLAIIDYQHDGPEVLRELKRREPALKVLVLSKEQNLLEVITAMKMGGTYFLTKPLKEAVLRDTVHHILEGMTFEMLEVYGAYPWFLTHNAKVEELLKSAKNAAMHPMDVILCGEQGTGKGALSVFIHQNTVGQKRQLAELNVGFFRGQMVETHFWAALREIYQEYESTVPGQREPIYSTLFIQGLEAQDIYFRLSLLEWLKQKRIEAEANGRTPVRVILGVTSQETLSGVQSDMLKDLIWLSAVPLRERREDIPLLVEHFIREYNKEFNKRVAGCSMEALGCLMRYPWPGNVRELQLMLQSVLARISPVVRYITSADLPLSLDMIELMVPSRRYAAVVPLAESVSVFEELVLGVLVRQKNYDRAQLVEFLGETSEVIEDKLVRYNLLTKEGE